MPAQYTQINIANPPAAAWTTLSGQQIENVLTNLLELARVQEERRFQLAKSELDTSTRRKLWALGVGATIATLGLGSVVYLSATGHETTAVAIGSVLATLVAVFLGKKAL